MDQHSLWENGRKAGFVVCYAFCVLKFRILQLKIFFYLLYNPISTVDIFILWLCQCLQMVVRMRGLPPLFFMVMVLMTQTSRGCVLEAGVEGCDKLVMSKFRRNTILRPFFDIFERLLQTQNFFFEKLPPGIAKTVFENPKGPHFGCWKKNYLNQVFIKAMWWHLVSRFQNGITLRGIVRPNAITWLW